MMSPEGQRTAREHRRLLRCNLPLHKPENVLAFVFRSLDHHTLSGSEEEYWDSQTSCSRSEVSYQLNNPNKLIEMFINVNKISMNKRIGECLDDVRLVGWIAPYTLLLNGPLDDLNVLKTAWSHRTLKSPKGFLLEDVGLVKSFNIESIPIAQFIPLSSALYDAIEELDRNGDCTTRDSIIRYLKDVYHDVRIPELTVVHKCLGKLIEERRIYHNGVGYHALLDESPLALRDINNNNEKDKANSSSDNVQIKVKDEFFMKNSKEKPRRNISAHFSNDKCLKKTKSNEQKYHLPIHDNQIKNTQICNPVKKTNKEKGASKKKLKSYANQCSSLLDEDSSGEQEVKIIDISSEASSIRFPYERHPKEFDQEFKNSPFICIRNVNNKKGKEEAMKKDTKFGRRKTHRSRSFTEPCKLKIRNQASKVSDTDSDFPLRRAIGIEELQKVKDNESKHNTRNVNKDIGAERIKQDIDLLPNFQDERFNSQGGIETNNDIEKSIELHIYEDNSDEPEQRFLKRVNKEDNLTFFCVIAKNKSSTSRTVQEIHSEKSFSPS